MTVAHTARKQNKNVFKFLTSCCRSTARPPSHPVRSSTRLGVGRRRPTRASGRRRRNGARITVPIRRDRPPP